MRQFPSGATRDDCDSKPDFEGFYSPLVIKRFGEYMNKHRKQADGKLRDSDNWQKGIPKDAYIKSAWRHFMDWWMEHRGYKSRDGLEDALCALLFNIQGYLFEILKANPEKELRDRINKLAFKKPDKENDRPFIIKGQCDHNHPQFINTTCDLGYACDACPYNKDKSNDR